MKPPLAYYGAKVTIAPQIAALLPAHEHYVELYAGSLAVLLAKEPSRMETVNDLNRELLAFWRMLRDRPAELERVCALTPHSRAEHDVAYEPAPEGDDIEAARRVWIRLTQGRSNGLQRRVGWRHRVSAGHPLPSYLRGYVERFGPAAARLAHVSLECMPALDLITKYGSDADVVLYADPPYVRETRNSTHYRHEMTDAEHRDLADALSACRASVVLSGYSGSLYDQLYDGWHTHEIAVTNTQGGAAALRTEVLWSNRPFPADAPLFDLEALA